MAIQKEIWENHIEGNLFKNNEFLLASTDASQYVLQGKVVHIPQAGALPSVQKNRTTLPGSVIQRTDTDVTYSLDEFSTDPILIPQADTVELSYNKRESILSEHEASLRQMIAETILGTWAPTGGVGTQIPTTGTAIAAHLPSGTGNRKKFVSQDLKSAQLILNRQNIPMEERYAVMSADMFQQLTDEMSDTQYRDFSALYDAKNGILGRLFGFNIIMRSTVVSYNNSTQNVNPYNATPAAADNDGVICWQANAVERALGNIHIFENIGDPTYYGDVYSVTVRMGARKRRTNAEGIVAIVQAATA